MNNLDTIDFNRLGKKIKLWGIELGFSGVGFSEAADLPASLRDYWLKWLEKNYHGEMKYLEKKLEERFSPKYLMPEVKSIISVRLNYYLGKKYENSPIAQIKQAKDYHVVLNDLLEKLAGKIRNEVVEFSYQIFVDRGPILEKPLGENTGLGWIGKNTLLINNKDGSYFSLGEIFTNLALPPDQKVENRCGSCQRCLAACPTKALVAPYQLDARRCIAYLTLAKNVRIPDDLAAKIPTGALGCDICQKACPWNRFARRAIR
jgi:epoxyqueuosine reductase